MECCRNFWFLHHKALFPSAHVCWAGNVEEDGGSGRLAVQFLQLLHCKEHQHCVSATPKAKGRAMKEQGTGKWTPQWICFGDKSFIPAPEKIWEEPVVESGSTFLAFKTARSMCDQFLTTMNLNGHTLSRMIQVCCNAERCLGQGDGLHSALKCAQHSLNRQSQHRRPKLLKSWVQVGTVTNHWNKMLRRTKSEMFQLKAQSLISCLPRSEWSAAYHGTYSKQQGRVRISFLDFCKTHIPIPIISRQPGIPLKTNNNNNGHQGGTAIFQSPDLASEMPYDSSQTAKSWNM